MRRRALVVCPGRGSYDRAGMGQLQGRSEAAAAVVARCDAFRAERGATTVAELDRAEGYSTKLHVAGENASLLTFACSLADLADLDREAYEVVGVCGNSMGWYTALAASGALSLDEAIRLVETMGEYQRDNVIGGQILYPVTDEAWRVLPERVADVEAALGAARAAGGQAYWSIRLGAHAVLGADEAGLATLMAELPKVSRGGREFPARLPLHSAFHTPLMAETSARAQEDLEDLGFQAPEVPLVDGDGTIYRPRWAAPRALAGWTLGDQVVRTYDFGRSVVTALRHTAPEVVIALGPGNALGAPLASVLVGEGWAGVRDRAGFEAKQAGDEPVLLSFGVEAQRARLVRGR